MRRADLLSPWAAAGREPGGGRSAHSEGMPSFRCSSQSQMTSPSPGLEMSFLASERQPAGTRVPEAVPDRSLSREGWVWHHPGYLLPRTARRGEDAPLSVACHLVPSGPVCASPRLRASPNSAGGDGSSLVEWVGVQGRLGAARTRCPLGPEKSGMGQLGQRWPNSWQWFQQLVLLRWATSSPSPWAMGSSNISTSGGGSRAPEKCRARFMTPAWWAQAALNWETHVAPWAKAVRRQWRCQGMPMQKFPSRTRKEKPREDSLSLINHSSPYQGEHSASD